MMSSSLASLSLLLLWSSFAVDATEYTFTQTISSSYVSQNQQLVGHVINTFGNTYVVTQCARRCLTTANCQSYNYLPLQQSCQLNSASHVSNPSDLTTSTGSQYYVRTAWNVNEAALGPCAQSLCLNNGTCITQYPGTSSVNQISAVCICAAGWTGQTCNIPVPSYSWSLQWSTMSKCSVSCGPGYATQTRSCVSNAGITTSNTKLCAGPSQQTTTCNLGPCPAWTAWSVYGACSTTGGCGPGVQVSTRSCTNGGTVGVDPFCMGSTNRTTPCQSTSCTAPVRLSSGPTYGEGRVDVYDDVTNQWLPVCATGWTQADANVVCYQLGFPSGAYSLSAVGSYPSMRNANGSMTGVNCAGSETTLAQCPHTQWYDPTCIAGPHAGVQCIVDGRWSNFGNWSACSVTCGSGVSTQTRQCNSPPPLRGGKTCAGSATNSTSCSGPSCAVNGEWSEWAAWEACSATCGAGVQQRSRTCANTANGGIPCPGNATETQTCNDGGCPVNCTWNVWSAWSICSVTCGGGIQSSNRTQNPALNNGAPCTGEDTETQSCNPTPCPVNCVWNNWSAWGACTASCGGGTTTRVRSNIPAAYGGLNCTGPSQVTQSCNNNACPVPGVWGPWSQWGSCSATCGTGSQTQTRICNMTSNGVNNTLPCAGSSIQSQICNKNPCSPVASSCAALYIAGLTENTYVTIQPDTTQTPFTVFCQKNSTTGQILTVVHNLWENGVAVSSLSPDPVITGLKSGLVSYVDNLNASISITQVTGLVGSAGIKTCSQFISFSCKNAPFNSPKENPVTGNTRLTYWTSRLGDPMGYWGGANVELHSATTMTCACDNDGSCGTSSTSAQLLCNCDHNDNTLREDSGYLTNIGDLPVKGFATVDFGASQFGEYTMGPLICST